MSNVRRHTVTTMLRIVLTLLLLIWSLATSAGNSFSKEGKALFDEIQNHLVTVGVCKSNERCYEVAPIYGRDGRTIELNLYAANDPTVVKEVFGFVAANGLRITHGKPIALSAFPKPKEEYVNSVKGMLANRNPPVTLELKRSDASR